MYGEYNRSGSLASIANRVSYVLNLHGPSMTLDTMCSSSLTAIHIACQDLRLGRTDMALAGGVNLSVHPGKYSMLSGGQFISSEGHCASFGEGGDGYIPGEGVGVVVLKRLSDAERDGDAIHAVIRGSALNHGGKTNGYTVPNPQAQAAVIADALKDAGVDARHVSYIEAHGTGTKLGDPIEIAAISKAFREHTQDRQFCLIGSAKSNIGHCESAAGIAGLTKVILQMRYGQIVPSLHSERLNPNTDFDITPFEVNQRLRPWDAPVIDGRKLPLIAGVSSFGAGGGNAHLVVEAYSGSAANAFQGGTAPRVVLLSARTLPQLRQKAEELSAFVGKNVDIDLDSLAFTLQTGREPMEERLGMLVESRSELTEKLAAFLAADNLEDGAVADDLYYAQSRRHRDTIALFGIDQDLRASIDNWFGGGKLSRLLDMWTKGLDLDWLKLYGSSLPARVHLPVYPFARERYWREEPAGVSPGGVPDADAIHSLVHRNASRPGQQRYRSTFGADDPRLSGLGRPGHSAFPMSLQIEAARAALGDALPSLQQGGTWALQDVRFAAPRRTNGPTLVDIAVLPPGQGERTSTAKVAFELCAGDADGYVFSQGFAESCPTAQPPVLDIASITRGASPLFADRRAIAAAVRGLGLEIGTAHSAADALHRTEDGLWLGLVPSDAAQTAFSDCAINPAIFEALTLAAQWLHPASERLHLPAGFAEMRVYPGSSQPRYARIQATGPVRQDGAFCVDVAVCAGDGTVRIQIESLEMRPIGALAEPVVAPVAVQLERIEAVATAQQALAAERMPDREFRVRSEHTSNARTGAAASDFSAGPAVPKPSITLASPKQAAVEPAGSSLDKSPVSLASQRDEPGASQLASVLLRDRGQGIFALRLRPADDRLDAGLVDAFREALAHARELPSIKALIIESDQRVFLLDGAGGLDDRALQDLQRELASFPFPTVAILEGQAVGAGLWLACTCDLVVAVEDQHYGFASPEGTWIAQASHLSWLSARFGEALAPLLATAERLLTGGELRGSGWGATVVSSGEVTSAVDAICGRLSDKSHNALRLLKEHLAAEFETRLSMFAASMPSEAADAVLTGPGQAAPETATATDAAVTLLSGEDDKRVHLRLRADGATPADVLLQQLEHALRGCGNADVVLLSSEYEGFLPDDASQHGDVLRDALAALSRVSAPVVAVLENSALNSGLLLALACDFAVYSEEGRYGAIALADHHEHLGLFDDLLTRRLGASAHEWALTGERHSGLDLLRRQPLLHVCPADQVLDRAQRLADHVRTLPRGTSVPLRLSPVEGDARASSRAMDSAGEPTAQGDIALTSTVVRASVDDTGVVLVRLEDRDARNMFSDALIAGLQEVFEHIRLSSNYKAVVLVGYDTYFSSGGTRDGLKAIQQGKVRFTDHDVFHLPMRCHLPVIAAMQGHGIGAGWTLGLFSDCVIFSQESSYVSPYMDFGFTPGAGASRVLPEKLGFDLARESLFTSREMPGQELARRNPHLTVVPRDRALTDALALASELSRNSRGDLIAWKSAHVSHRLADWKDLFAREVRMHEATLVGQTDALARIEKRFGPAPQAVAQPVGEPVALAADPAAQAVPAETAVLPVIRRLLADELRVDESDIDPRAQFVDVGLDSISSVTWIRNINKQFGLDIDATKVYSYPDLQKFARYIGGQLPAASVAPVASAAPVQQTTSVMPSVREPAEGAAGRMEVLSHGLTTPAPVSPHVDARIVSRTIIDLLAQELRQEPESIDADRGFVELGLDSISGVTWIRAVNKVYGTSIEATKVYTYPTVAKFARFLSETLAQDAAVQAPPLQVHPTATRQSAVAPATPLAPINAQLSGWPVLPSWQTSGAPATAAPAHPATGAHTAEIAVIGMAGRFPMADDLDMFWDNIANGRNCVSEIPASRWDTQSYYVEGKPGLGQSNSKWMGLLEGHDQFDPTFFGLSPVEAEAMDPQQRVFLQTCWHGMENAGYTAERMSGSKCGVFVGCSYGDYNLLSREQQINSLGFTGNATSILAARVSYFLNLVGPCVSLDTACSSSLVAIATACDSLLTGGSDMALAGGVYVMANSDMFLKTAQAGMLSSDGRCYTFDQRANGFVPGEGVGVVMLKRLADAERDGDRVLAVVRGWGVNQDGRTNGITAPNAESQQRLISDVHDRFGIDAAAIGLVEAHGTGTKLGDPIEIDGLKSSFPKPTARKQHCAIGSVKTNIGHCLTAAGVSGFIKLLLALKHQKLPPSINFETPNEHFDLEDSPFYVNTSLQDWAEPPGAVRHAAISSFGFSGTNAHLVLSQYTPAVKSPVALPAPLEGGCLVALSARTAEQLVQKAIDLRRFITNEPGLDLEAIACSLLMQRDAMDERLCFVAHSLQDVLDRLAAYVDRAGATGPLPTRMFAANVKQGRESVRLLSEDPSMAALVIDKCIAERNLAKLGELWVKGLVLDGTRLYGTNKPEVIALPAYPFAKDAYWIVAGESTYADAPSPLDQRSSHLHPLLQEKLAGIGEMGHLQADAEHNAGAEAADRPMLMHLPTYEFARMRCWIPTKDEVRASTGAGTDAATPKSQQGRLQHSMESIAELFAQLEQDTLTAGEVADRVKQLA
ncbi:MAG: polyketide synthase [Pseudomonadota bacterium]|nr:polyketide synthase [Pseudomonadota bacterium]